MESAKTSLKRDNVTRKTSISTLNRRATLRDIRLIEKIESWKLYDFHISEKVLDNLKFPDYSVSPLPWEEEPQALSPSIYRGGDWNDRFFYIALFPLHPHPYIRSIGLYYNNSLGVSYLKYLVEYETPFYGRTCDRSIGGIYSLEKNLGPLKIILP